jgi:glucokinase
LASGAAILQRLGVESVHVREACPKDSVTPAEYRLISLVQEGNSNALKVISEAGHFLGIGIATVINIFNPSLIILAGGTLRWSGYFEAALQSTKAFSLPELWANCQVQQSDRGGDLVALGAIRAMT